MRHSLMSIKRLSIALGIAGAGVLASLPALAQSSSSSPMGSEIEMSKEGMVILCERTPLNSRCEGSPYYSGSGSSFTGSPSGTNSPTQDLPSESEVPSSTNEPTGVLIPDVPSSGSNSNMSSPGSMGTPSNTTAPTENLPSESDEPSSMDQPSGGMMPNMSSPGSNSTTTSPSNTSAPTQNLPSESDAK